MTTTATPEKSGSAGFSIRRVFQPITYALARAFHMLLDLMDAILSPLQKRVGVNNMAYFFILPNMIIFSIFILLPMLLNFYYAFTGGTQLFPQDRTFVGTQNLERLFECENFMQPGSCREDRFWRAVFNTAGFVVAEVGLMILLSLVAALALNRKIIGRGFFRSVFFYPVLLSPVVVALIWRWILQQDGLLNAIIMAFGGDRVPFLLSADWARFWIVIISVWAQMGFYTLILLAGLQAIPSELYEAASIDGASTWRAFIAVTMPLLMPTMLVVIVLAVIRSVQVFDIVYVFTGGGPGTATYYLVQYIYNTGFTNMTKQYGLAASASMVLAVVLVIFTLFQLRLGRTSGISEGV